jgi:hypothetical protein
VTCIPVETNHIPVRTRSPTGTYSDHLNQVVIITTASLAFDELCTADPRHFCYRLLISELANVMAETCFHIAWFVKAKFHQLIDPCLRARSSVSIDLMIVSNFGTSSGPKIFRGEDQTSLANIVTNVGCGMRRTRPETFGNWRPKNGESGVQRRS